MEAFLHSLKVAGIIPVENSLDCDAVVIWSVLWNGRMQANKAVYEHYRSQGKPVIVIDVGALKREITWKISVNYSKLQAQREVHFDLFQIIAKKSLFAVMEVKIFFDEASTPQRTSLTYEVEVCEQTLSVSELVDMADAFDK